MIIGKLGVMGEVGFEFLHLTLITNIGHNCKGPDTTTLDIFFLKKNIT